MFIDWPQILVSKDMELKVWVEGIQRIVCGVTESTTCQVSIKNAPWKNKLPSYELFF